LVTHTAPSPRPPQATFLPHPALPARGRLVLYDLSGVAPDPAALAALGLAAPAGATTAGRDHAAIDGAAVQDAKVRLALPGPDGLPALAEVAVTTVDLLASLPLLLRLGAPGSGADAPTPASDGLRVWAAAARAVLALVAQRRVLPALRRPDGEGGVVGGWRIAADDPGVAEVVRRVAEALPVAGYALAAGDDGLRVWEPEALVRALGDALADLAVREASEPPRPGRPRARLLPWTARWAEALVDPVDPQVPLRHDADELLAGADAWAGGEVRAVPSGTAEFTLRAPGSLDGAWRLDLGVRTDDGVAVPASAVWSVREGGRGGRGEGEGALQQTLLRALVRAARLFPPLDAVLDDGAPEGLDLDLLQAWAFVERAADQLLSTGISVVLPTDLTAGDLAVRVRVGGFSPPAGAAGEVDERDVAGQEAGSREAADADPWRDAPLTELPDLVRMPGSGAGGGRGPFAGLLTGFRWEVALGGEAVSEEEFAQIVAAKAPLVRIRERWVRVDPARLARLERLGPPGELPLADALALGLAGSERAGADLLPGLDLDEGETVDVVVDGGVAALVERLREAGERPPAPAAPPGFAGELRPYQSRGVAWLQGMGELGLGAVLADDMGLGKTVQLAAYLLTLPEGAGPHLVICPTSVVGNWQRELARFAPSLTVTRHHGPERAETLDGVGDVVLTSYGTLRRDVDLLAGVLWDVVALDEAQQVKNPNTSGARAVRRLTSRQTVALTGTPLENRLSELWSLLDATNPGLLGSRARFGRRFVAPIEQQRAAETARRLRRLVAPFILRREKRDPAVVADLPDKIERTVHCSLTPEQAGLYQAAVDRVLGGGGLDSASSFERRGRILALLTELKQICNHPAQYLRERAPGAAPPVLPGRSGKLEAARDIVAEAVAGGAQVLVFTQYVEMGHLLTDVLGADLDRTIPFLYGVVPAAQRDRMVAAFQGEPEALEELDEDSPPPVLLVSLRAGGTGLNLTAATHVVHFDRWWNPAVEDQATDRAHRIGQSSTVEVHKLVTAGTVEERVAEVLERKRELAEQVVGSGEAWVTELGDRELADLVALAADAPVTDLDDWSVA